MTVQEAIAYYGNITALARAVHIRPPSVHGWIERGSIPIGRQYQLEVVTDGALRADREHECAA